MIRIRLRSLISLRSLRFLPLAGALVLAVALVLSGPANAAPAQGTGDPSITTASLSSGTVGTSYSQTVGVNGSFPPFTWSVTSGSLPPGLSLSSGSGASGTISGTPTTAGTYDFTLQVTDILAETATQALSITISHPVPALTVTTTRLAAGTTRRAYSQTLAANGGRPPYTWSVASGSLPRGLSLRANGVIAGTPATAGTYHFTVRVTDHNGTRTTKALTIQVTKR